MTSQTADELQSVPVDDEEQRRLKTEFTRRLLKLYPDAANEIREEGIERGIERGVELALAPLTHQFERKLRRTLSADEHATIARRLRTIGAARLGDVVLDLSAEELDRWLGDPEAR